MCYLFEFHFVVSLCRYQEVDVVWYCVTALPVLLKPPTVSTSQDGRYLVMHWPEWLADITGNGTGPVVSYTLQGLVQLNSGSWQDLVTVKQLPLTASAHSATTVRWFTYVAKGCFNCCLFFLLM